MNTGKEPRPEKQAIAREIKALVDDCVFVILTDYKGMKVSQASALREELIPLGSSLHVVKNRIFGKVVEGTSLAGLADELSGPTAMIAGDGDVVAVAKILKRFKKEIDLPAVKIGSLRGVVLSAGDIDVLATLPSREVLQAQLVGTIAAPMTQLVGVMNQKVLSLLYVLKAAQEKKQAA